MQNSCAKYSEKGGCSHFSTISFCPNTQNPPQMVSSNVNSLLCMQSFNCIKIVTSNHVLMCSQFLSLAVHHHCDSIPLLCRIYIDSSFTIDFILSNFSTPPYSCIPSVRPTCHPEANSHPYTTAHSSAQTHGSSSSAYSDKISSWSNQLQPSVFRLSLLHGPLNLQFLCQGVH